MAKLGKRDFLLDNTKMNTRVISNDSLMWKSEVKVAYKVDEIPPLMVTLFLGFQHYISMAIATLTIPILLAPVICMEDDHVGKSEITGTLFVASGLITLLQTFFGIRLPIVQAGTFAILVPTISYLKLPEWKCPSNIGAHDFNGTGSSHSFIITGSPEHKEIWMSRLREIQGCIMVAAMFEVLIGLTGVIGWMMKFIGPLTICPTVTLLGLSLFKNAPQLSAKYWPIAIMVLVLMLIFSQYCGNIKVPCLLYTKEKKCHTKKFKMFKMFSIVLSIMLAWFLCYILTITDFLPSDKSSYGYFARTDLHSHSIQAAPWFRLPYPGQWGFPTFSISGIMAIFVGILATTIESVGDYYACAKLSGAPPPPVHAINRGILIEGIGSMLDGLFGTGNGTTSTSINVGVIGITKVGSRVVVQVSALIMIIFGLFIKVGAIFLSIPDPIIGGTFFILFGMIVAIGLSNLQHVNLNSGRNLFILGISLLLGMAIPEYITSTTDTIQTGNLTLNNILTVLFRTHIFVGGVTGFILDNSIPATRKTRGMEYWDRLRDSSIIANEINNTNSSNSEGLRNDDIGVVESASDRKESGSLKETLSRTYDLPFVSNFLSRFEIFRKIPLCPAYRGYMWKGTCCGASNCCWISGTLINKYKSLCVKLNDVCNKDEEEEDEGIEDVELVIHSISEDIIVKSHDDTQKYNLPNGHKNESKIVSSLSKDKSKDSLEDNTLF